VIGVRRLAGLVAAAALVAGGLLIAPAANASPPGFIVHSRVETKGQYKGWMRYEVQSSNHWAYDRVWEQCIATGYEQVGFLTVLRKTADRRGHVVFHIMAVKGHPRMRCRFYSPAAPGYPAEVSETFRLEYKR
jgi:hypothetical protein